MVKNARLAAKLTGWKIDIKSESDAKDLQLEDKFMTKEEPSTESSEVDALDEEEIKNDSSSEVTSDSEHEDK